MLSAMYKPAVLRVVTPADESTGQIGITFDLHGEGGFEVVRLALSASHAEALARVLDAARAAGSIKNEVAAGQGSI